MSEVHAFIREDEVDKMISEAEARGYAKAIDEAAAAVRAQREIFTQPSYAGGALGAIGEIFACNEIEAAILALKENPQ